MCGNIMENRGMKKAEETNAPACAGGMVWLVGAGPGDPGLCTLRAAQCIGEADVILYDALVHPRLLDHAAPGCECIATGKRAGGDAIDQDALNAMMADFARAGKRVCRLKGGDPFVLGRGGEEAAYLRAQGILFEIVPGVTSALAAPACAGIPVTHRGVSAAVRIVSGHEAPDKDAGQVRWDAVRADGGTLVVLMGLRRLEAITGMLIANGWSPETPAAVVAHGTLPSQRTVCAPLAQIARSAADHGLDAPAVLVVGEVVGLREQLAWLEQRPLFGRCIMVVRPRAQAVETARALADLGAEALIAPVIRIEFVADSPAMAAAVGQLPQTDWVVFTSVHGVDALMACIARAGGDARMFGGVRIAAVGPATAARLAARGLAADLVPDRYLTEALPEALAGRGTLAGRRIMLPRSEIAASALADALRACGAAVTEVAAYRVLPGEPLDEALLERLEQGRVDLVLFASPSEVDGFIAAVPSERREGTLPRITAAAIGPVTERALRAAGFAVALSASEHSMPGFIRAVCDYFARGPRGEGLV